MTEYPFTNAEEERRKKRAELSDFRRNHQSSLNYLRSTMQSVIPSLLKEGMSEKELELFIKRVLEQSKEEVKSEAVESDMKELLNKLIQIYESKEESGSERERQFAQRCLEIAEWYLRPKKLDTDDLKSEREETTR